MLERRVPAAAGGGSAGYGGPPTAGPGSPAVAAGRRTAPLALVRELPVLAIVALVVLFPVVTIGPFIDALGGHGAVLRSGFLVAMLGFAVLAHGPGIPRPPARLRPVVAGLGILAAFGVVSAFANTTSAESVGALASQLVGQPLVMAALLIYLSALLRDNERGTDLLLAAFAVGVVGEAGIIIWELASGAAYDPLRGFTRAQGTVGANFIGAFAMMAIFIGLAGIARARSYPLARTVGAVTLVAAAVIIVGAVARSAVIGLAIGGLYVVVAEPRFRRRALPIAAAAIALALGSLLTPAGDLWSSRLNANSVEAFDRPATWISGVRIALDDPLTGVGEREIVRDIDDVRRYRQTPLGDTSVLPHNSWILTFAEGGIAALAVLVALTGLVVMAIRPPPGGRTTEERFYVAALLGIGTIALVNNVFRHPELMVPVLMMVSILGARVASRAPGSVRGEPEARPAAYDPRLNELRDG